MGNTKKLVTIISPLLQLCSICVYATVKNNNEKVHILIRNNGYNNIVLNRNFQLHRSSRLDRLSTTLRNKGQI